MDVHLSAASGLRARRGSHPAERRRLCRHGSAPRPGLLWRAGVGSRALLARVDSAGGGCGEGRAYAHYGAAGPDEDSLALLCALALGHSSGGADEAALDAICAELGDLPLALHLAGSFLVCYRAATTPAAYLAELHSMALLGHESLQGDGAETSPTGHVLHAGRTFALSWERLDPADTVDALARDLLQRVACLAPGEPIPHALA